MIGHAGRAEAYRTKAEECRTLAEEMHDSEARKMLMQVAADYLRMADTLDRMIADKPP